MATYDNTYSSQFKITPANPLLRGMSDNYSNDGQTNLGGYGLGNIYELDYDRNKIEQIFNQGTDAQYALMQKEAQVAENNYANQQFQNQFNTMEALRAQRNEQIASGMARGINAASDQATALGVQQEAMNGALELAQNRQMQADQIAAEYAQNVVKALQEANSVKQAMANVAAQLYEADMLGYTGELSALGQLDANASDRYGYDLGLEGTKYQADANLEGVKDYNQKYFDQAMYGWDAQIDWNKYNADRNYAAQVDSARIQAEATVKAAATTAAAYRSSGSSGGYGGYSQDTNFILDCYNTTDSRDGMIAALQYGGIYSKSEAIDIANDFYKNYKAATVSFINPQAAKDVSNGIPYQSPFKSTNTTTGKSAQQAYNTWNGKDSISKFNDVSTVLWGNKNNIAQLFNR